MLLGGSVLDVTPIQNWREFIFGYAIPNLRPWQLKPDEVSPQHEELDNRSERRAVQLRKWNEYYLGRLSVRKIGGC
jgi:hypothetical protein